MPYHFWLMGSGKKNVNANILDPYLSCMQFGIIPACLVIELP